MVDPNKVLRIGVETEQQKFDVEAWLGEFTTLLGLWRRLLPFGLIVPEATLPSPRDIFECSVQLPRPKMTGPLKYQQFILMLWDEEVVEDEEDLDPLRVQLGGDSSLFHDEPGFGDATLNLMQETTGF